LGEYLNAEQQEKSLQNFRHVFYDSTAVKTQLKAFSFFFFFMIAKTGNLNQYSTLKKAKLGVKKEPYK